jgi:hypothetical protein
METLALLFVAAAALVAFVVAPRCPLSLRWLLAITGFISAVGAYSLFLMPSDFLVRYPFAATVLHPWLVALYGGIAFILFCGIALGLIGRYFHTTFHARHRQPNDRNA